MKGTPNTLQAVKTVYPASWKLGERPTVETVGFVALPDNWHDTEAEMICRKTFPQANGYRATDGFGRVVIIAVNLL